MAGSENTKIIAPLEADITVLDYPECVRMRKEMYLSDKTHAVFEIIDNAVDEHLAGRCSAIQVQVDENEHITVIDNGSGIPVEKHSDPRYSHLSKAEVAFTVLHAGGKFGSKENSYATATSGLHGVGASCTNATSSMMALTVFKNKQIYQAQFEKGMITSNLKIIGDYIEDFTGTQVEFDLDPEIWKDEKLDLKRLERRLKQLAYLNPGLTISYTSYENNGALEFCYPEGVRSYVQELIANKTALTPIFYSNSVIDEVSVQFSFVYTDASSSDVYSFCNNVHTEAGGDHLIGFNHGVAKAINDYARDKKILKDGQKFDISDCLEGITGVISIVAKEVAFEGQGKSKIKMGYIRPIVRTYVAETLFNHMDHNPDEARTIIDKVMLAEKARLAANKAREGVRKQKDGLSGKAKGLKDCSEKDPALCEIYIVEGDSAGGTVKAGRDQKTQAVLPLFGKIINTEKTNDDKIFDNIKIEMLLKAIKVQIGEDFDISTLRYHKIIILTDADIDGEHIQILYITFFYRWLRPIIDAGMLYVGTPPLYRIDYGKNKHKYVYSDSERDSLIAEIELAGEVVKYVQRYKGLGEMNADQLWDTTLDPEVRTLIQITVEDAEAAEEALEICMGKAVPPRRAFIEENALYAQLDI